MCFLTRLFSCVTSTVPVSAQIFLSLFKNSISVELIETFVYLWFCSRKMHRIQKKERSRINRSIYLFGGTYLSSNDQYGIVDILCYYLKYYLLKNGRHWFRYNTVSWCWGSGSGGSVPPPGFVSTRYGSPVRWLLCLKNDVNVASKSRYP